MNAGELMADLALSVLIVYGWILAVAFAFGFAGAAMTKIAAAVAVAKARAAESAGDVQRAAPGKMFERVVIVCQDGTRGYFTMPAGIDKIAAHGMVWRRTDEAVPDVDGSRLAVVFRSDMTSRDNGGEN